MKILSFDTALAACSVACLDMATGAQTAEREDMRRGHAEALIPMIERVMAAAGWTFGMLDRIAVTTGPGTFTGIRVGVAAARGLALAADRPALGFTTLEAHAAGLMDQPDLPAGRDGFAIALDARRGEVYFQLFSTDGSPACRAEALAPERAAARLEGASIPLFGSGAPLVAACLERNDPSARPELHALPAGPDPLALARLAARSEVPSAAPSPFYLRPPDAKPQAAPLPRAGTPPQ